MTETEAWAARLPPHEDSRPISEIDTSTEAVERLARAHQTVGDNPARYVMGHPHHWRTAAVLRQLVKERNETRAALAASQTADLDLSQPAPKPRPEGLCEIHPLCKGLKK